MLRREFIRKALGVGAAVAVPSILVPERKIWQVHPNMPVRTPVQRFYEDGGWKNLRSFHTLEEEERLPEYAEKVDRDLSALKKVEDSLFDEVTEGQREFDALPRDEQVLEAIGTNRAMRRSTSSAKRDHVGRTDRRSLHRLSLWAVAA